MKPLRSVFLRAAKLQFKSMDEYKRLGYSHESRFACDNISDVAGHWSDAESNMFYSYFGTNKRTYGTLGLAWWPRKKNKEWDHESRILALLLCAEMLRR